MAEGTEDDRADTRWLSYSDLAEARGISRESAIRMARRRRWPKREGNDGTIRVAVPRSIVEGKPHISRDSRGDGLADVREDIPHKISGLETALGLLAEQLQRECSRGDAAEARAQAAEAQVRELEAQVRELIEQTAALREDRAAEAARAEALQAELERLLRRGLWRRFRSVIRRS
jgi:hypothetical protein